MTHASKTILFFGTDAFSAVSLRALLDAQVSIAGVFTKPDSQQGRGRKLSASVVKEIALEHDIPVHQPTSSAELHAAVSAYDNPAGILVSYGRIIPQWVLDIFSPGIINVHPSLLPKYRGPSPIESAILHGDKETGVSVMQLTAAMDAGPVYGQVSHILTGAETAPELEATLAEQGADLLVRLLPDILDGSCQATPQDDTDTTYCNLLSKNDAVLDLSLLTAAQAERQVRAFLAFPKSKLTVLGQPIVVTQASVQTEQQHALDLKCADGAFLRIEHLIGPSGKPMTAAAFLNGYAKA